MTAYKAIKKAVTLSPTVRTLSSGVPFAPLLNLSAKGPHDPHSHGHSESNVRSDAVPRWAGGVSRASTTGFVSKTMTTGA